MEEWKPVVGFEDYMVSSLGRIKSLDRYVESRWQTFRKVKGIILSQSINKDGYNVVTISNTTIRKQVRVHRLVAKAFINNINFKLCINHKDGCKTNNIISNLEWCTIQENVKHSVVTGLQPNGKRIKSSKAVIQLDKYNNIINYFESIGLASKHTGISVGNIHSVCKDRTNTAGGFIWKFDTNG